MVLHIAVDGDLKHEYIRKLCLFFMKKQYKIKTVGTPVNDGVLYILNNGNTTNHEKILLKAFDRSFSYYGTDWNKYDIVIWSDSIITDYLTLSNENIPLIYIKQCNKYFPQMDLHILIGDYDITGFKENCVKIIPSKNEDITFNKIVRACFDNLPKCNWCPRLFKPNKYHKKYCSDKCREASLEEQYRINKRRYYHKYKDVMSEKQKGALGSKNANLHGKADLNPIAELQKVRNAKKSLGLKPIQ